MIGSGNSLRMFSFEEKKKQQRLAMGMIQWPPFYIYVFAHCTIVFWHSFAFKSRSKDICIWAKTEIFCPSTKYTFCLEDQRHGKRVSQRTLKIPPLAVARFKEICREQKRRGAKFSQIFSQKFFHCRFSKLQRSGGDNIFSPSGCSQKMAKLDSDSSS